MSRKVLNSQPKGVKRGQGQSGPFLSFQAKQADWLQYVLLLSLPPLAELLLLSAHCPFQIFPPFAMNALNARIWTTKPLAPGTSHRKRLKSVYYFSLLRNLTLPLFRFALRFWPLTTCSPCSQWLYRIMYLTFFQARELDGDLPPSLCWSVCLPLPRLVVAWSVVVGIA